MVSSRGLGDVYKRQDGTVGHAMFIEELQSDIQQTQRTAWKINKDPVGFLKSHAVSLLSTEYDWSALNEKEAQLVATLIEDVNKAIDADVEEMWNANKDADGKVQVNVNHYRPMVSRNANTINAVLSLSLIHISEPTRRHHVSRMPSSA